jgi:hypothetical protein
LYKIKMITNIQETKIMSFSEKNNKIKWWLCASIFSALMLSAALAFAANYPIEIIQPREGLTTHSRYYKAYPGIEYRVPVGVFGGMYPFTYELTQSPAGMAIDPDSGIISWSNPTTSGSPHRVTARVTDAENNTDSCSWTITVTTEGFIFLDANAADGGNGTIQRPLNKLSDVWGSDGSNSAYNDYFLYFRQGTYGIDDGWFDGTGHQYKVHWRPGDRHPHVWMAYPGESVTIDHNLEPGSNGAFIANVNGDSDIFFHNIRFRDMLNHAVRSGGDRLVVFECQFYNGGPGQDGDNSSFWMLPGAGPNLHHYPFFKNNIFRTAQDWAFFKSYGMTMAVIEGNSFSEPSGATEGLALKAYDNYVAVRANSFDGGFSAGAISGNWNDANNLDLSFNKIINAANNFSTHNYGAITINYQGTTGKTFIYRNTIQGTVTLRNATSNSGPFYIYNNIIVNRNEGMDSPRGSLITQISVDDDSCLELGTGDNENLVGAPEDNIINSAGNLTQEFNQYVGIKGHQPPSASKSSSGGGSGGGCFMGILRN